MTHKKYRKREEKHIIAVQLALNTKGFTYTKWGNHQQCKSGDWIVYNNGDCYTIDKESFSRSYEMIAPGQYRKISPIWAEQATAGGSVKTKEGTTHYKTGDYLVFNKEDGTDAYAISESTFEDLYTLDQ